MFKNKISSSHSCLVNEKNEPKISFLTFFSSFHILGFVFLLRWVLSSNKFLVFRALYAQSHGVTPGQQKRHFKEGKSLSLFVCSVNALWAYYVNSMKDYYYFFLNLFSLSLSLSLSPPLSLSLCVLGSWVFGGGSLNRSLSSLS